MMFWGDIILKYPKLIPELASFGAADVSRLTLIRADLHPLLQDIIALNWGYEANHPFEKEAATVRQIKNSVLRLSRHFDLANADWPP